MVSYILCVITIILLVRFWMKCCVRPTNYPPGPSWIPLVGNLFLIKRLSKQYGGLHLALIKLAEEYKTNILGLRLGEENIVFLFSHELVKRVLTAADLQSRPDSFFMKLRSMEMDKCYGLTTASGKLWSIQRSFVQLHFRNMGYGKPKMENFVNDELQEILEIISKNGRNQKPRDIFAPAILNVLWTFIIGRGICRSDKGLATLLQLADERIKAFDMAGGTLSHLPFLRFIAPEKTGYNLIKMMNSKVKSFFEEIFHQHMESWSDERSDDDLIYSFITEMKKNEGKETTFTEKQLLILCFDLFLGGSHTTSYTVDFAIFMMVAHPEIQQKIHECLDLEFGSSKTVGYAQKNRVPYVQAVLEEVLRFCHVVPVGTPRIAPEDISLDGYTIPKGTQLLVMFHSVLNDERYWKDPEVFRPERFLDEHGRFVILDRMTPFGIGKRRCLGDIMAKTFIFKVFVGIMRKFEVRLASGCELPTRFFKPGIILAPQDYTVDFITRIK